jgi:hypothetical protein
VFPWYAGREHELLPASPTEIGEQCECLSSHCVLGPTVVAWQIGGTDEEQLAVPTAAEEYEERAPPYIVCSWRVLH